MNRWNYCRIKQSSEKRFDEQDILVFLKLWFLRRYREVSIVLGLSILALGIYVFSMTYSPDDYLFLFKRCDFISYGRWVSHFIYNYLCMKNYLPVLSPLVGMTVMALAGFELTRLWRIRHFINRILIITVFTLHPYVLEIYSFRIGTVLFPWAYYLASLALNQRKGWMLSVLFCISLGIYQVTLGFVASAWLMALLFRLHANNYQLDKKLFYRHLAGWGWIVLGILVYFLIVKITLMEGHVNPRLAAGFFGSNLFRNLLKYSFILALRLSFIPEYVFPLIPKLGLFLCTVLGIGVILVKSKLRWPALLILFILPYAAILHVLPITTPYAPWRVSFGLIVLVAGFLGMILQHRQLHKTGLILGLFLVVSFVIVDNAKMFEFYIRNQRDMAMANQIACRIESLPEFRPGMKFIIIGPAEPAPLVWNGKLTVQAIKEFSRLYSRQPFGMEDSFNMAWSKYLIFCDFLQLPLIPTGPESEKAARQFIQTRGSKPWPHPSSVFIADDTVVLFLGPS
jgi:hypothetical protein